MTKESRMFPFITESRFNPLGGECKHNCYGKRCWAKMLIKQHHMKKYEGEPRLFERELKRVFSKDDFVFVCDMCDLFGEWVPSELITQIIRFANRSEAQFLFLTKNPSRYAEFDFGKNCVLGATIETDLDGMLANAPTRTRRIIAMTALHDNRKMLSIEPIMDFTIDFMRDIMDINPEFVAVGYDNYALKLIEPSLVRTEALIGVLEAFGIKVYRKTIREKWDAYPY